MQAKQQQMKLKGLQNVLVEEALTKHHLSPGTHKQPLQHSVTKALSNSSQFVITGKVIAFPR